MHALLNTTLVWLYNGNVLLCDRQFDIPDGKRFQLIDFYSLQPYNRIMDGRFDRIMYVRDQCLTGDPYKVNVRNDFFVYPSEQFYSIIIEISANYMN